MLEKLPAAVGKLLRGARAGMDEIVYHDATLSGVPETIAVRSAAFADGGPMPARHTADGDKVSPPLAWSGTPPGTACVALLVEDADSPTPEPLVHAIVWDIPGGDGVLGDGALPGPSFEGEAPTMGLNSYLKSRYLPPDPPPGHGPHRYAFQVYALSSRPAFGEAPGRGALVEALRTLAIGRGCVVGTYERTAKG